VSLLLVAIAEITYWLVIFFCEIDKTAHQLFYRFPLLLARFANKFAIDALLNPASMHFIRSPKQQTHITT